MSANLVREQVMFKTFTTSAGGAATEHTINLSSGQVRFQIVRLTMKRLAGTAATLDPFIVNVTGQAANSTAKVYPVGAAPASPTAVANVVDVAPTGAYGYTDINGNIYLVCGWNAAADNTASGVLAFKILA